MTAEAINYVANQCLLLFMGGRPTAEGPDIAEIEALVKDALALVGTQDYWRNYKEMNQASVEGYWLVTFQITLGTQDIEGTNRKVAVLTESPLALPKNRGVVKVKSNTGVLMDFVDFQSYDNALGGSVSTFTNKFWYTYTAGKVILLPNCLDKTIPFTGVYATLAVANDATMTESQVLLCYEKILPLLQVRFGVGIDTKTDDFVAPTKPS